MEKIYRNASPFDEDRYTKELMAKYGIQNVRGGSYVTMFLDEDTVDVLKREIWAAQDKCTTCGRDGHFTKDCHSASDVDGNIFVWKCGRCNKEFESENACDNHLRMCGKIVKRNRVVCFKCGTPGHYASNCYKGGRGFTNKYSDSDSDSYSDSYSDSDSDSYSDSYSDSDSYYDSDYE
jgi:hypothetical protein